MALSWWHKAKGVVFPKASPIVNAVHLQGIIAARAGPRGVSFAALENHLEAAFKGVGVHTPDAVALVVNSPGGSPVQSNLIGHKIQTLHEKYKVPVWAFAEDVAASGGYWLLAAGQEVYADKASIVGSVGVVSGGFGLHKLLEHHGIERRLHTAGTSKARLDPFLPARAEDVAYLRDTLAEIHEGLCGRYDGSQPPSPPSDTQVFKAHVRARRGAKISGHENTIFSGDFFTGARGVELGLVDAIGSLQSVSKEKLGEKVRINYLNARPRFPFLPGLGTGTGDGSRMSWSAHLADAILESAEERIEERLWRSRVGL